MMVVVLAAAVVFAVVANVLAWLIVTGPLGEPLLMCDCSATPPELSPMEPYEPALFSTIFGLGAVVMYAAITRLSTRPLRVFAVVATLVLVLSLGLPLMMPSPPVAASTKLALVAMHLVGYTVILGTLWFGHRRDWLPPSTNRSSISMDQPAT